MCPPLTWTTALLLITVATDQRLCWWIVGRGWSNRCTVCPWDHPNPRLVADNCRIFLSTFQYLCDFCWTQGCLSDCISVQLHARHSDSPWPSATGLPRDRVRCVNLAQISDRTDCPLFVRKPLQICFAPPSLFLTNEFNRHFIFVHERHVYQQKSDVIMTLHCVFCRVGLLHLLGSSFGNVCTKFTHISQKWFYFSMHYTLYLHISLGRCNWLRCRGGLFFWPIL